MYMPSTSDACERHTPPVEKSIASLVLRLCYSVKWQQTSFASDNLAGRVALCKNQPIMRILAAKIRAENSEAFDKAERLLRFCLRNTTRLTSFDELAYSNYQATIRTELRTQPDSGRTGREYRFYKSECGAVFCGFLLGFYLRPLFKL